MTRCRMCSQRMTRPGRVCRECEQERTLARSPAGAPGGFAPADRPLDETLAGPGIVEWVSQLRTRPALLGGAFVVGVGAAAFVYAISGLHGDARHESVMIDRDVSAVRPRNFQRASEPVAAEVATPPPSAGTKGAEAARAPSVGPRATSARPQAIAHVAAVSERPQAIAHVAAVSETPQAIAHVAAVSGRAPATYDRVLGLADALDGCSHESFFARLACEGRARAQYCDGTGGRIPQCADPAPREYGQ